MAILTKEAILNANDLPQKEVEVPEWGGTVLIRSLTGAQRDAFEASLVEDKGPSKSSNLKNLRARLVALSIVDEKGETMFTDKDVDALGKKSAKALDRVFDAAQSLNAFKKEDVEELVGN